MRNKGSVAESRGGKLQSTLLVQTSPGKIKQSLSCSCLNLYTYSSMAYLMVAAESLR